MNLFSSNARLAGTKAHAGKVLNCIGLLAIAWGLSVPRPAEARPRLTTGHFSTAKGAARAAAASQMNQRRDLRRIFKTVRIGHLKTRRISDGGGLRYEVLTRRRLPGSASPVASTTVRVHWSKAGWRADVPANKALEVGRASSRKRTRRVGWKEQIRDWHAFRSPAHRARHLYP